MLGGCRGGVEWVGAQSTQNAHYSWWARCRTRERVCFSFVSINDTPPPPSAMPGGRVGDGGPVSTRHVCPASKLTEPELVINVSPCTLCPFRTHANTPIQCIPQYLVNRFDVPDWLVPSLTELVTLLVFRQARRLVFGYDRRCVTKNDRAWREKASASTSRGPQLLAPLSSLICW